MLVRSECGVASIPTIELLFALSTKRHAKNGISGVLTLSCRHSVDGHLRLGTSSDAGVGAKATTCTRGRIMNRTIPPPALTAMRLAAFSTISGLAAALVMTAHPPVASASDADYQNCLSKWQGPPDSPVEGFMKQCCVDVGGNVVLDKKTGAYQGCELPPPPTDTPQRGTPPTFSFPTPTTTLDNPHRGTPP